MARRLGAGLVLAALAAGSLLGCAPHGDGDRTRCPADPVRARALAGLSSYVGWLRRHHVQGYVGEVGWPAGPDAARWNALGEAWYDAADAADLPVSAWAAAAWWPADYPMALYRAGAAGGPLDRAGSQAAVVERHAAPGRADRGVAYAGGAFGTDAPEYSAQRPGTYGRDYAYPSAADLAYLAGRGLPLVRLAFTWERMQPAPRGPLAPAELARLRSAVRAAHAAGLSVVLDLHSYARFRVAGPDGEVEERPLGSAGLPASDLADVWRRLAEAFRGEPGVWGYGLMNEPHDLPGGLRTWEDASQRAVDAIRATGDHTQVLVAGYGWSKAADWARTHPRPWVHDPDRAVRYEAHQYFDGDGSGRYAEGYRAEVAAARRAGVRAGC